MAAIFICLSVCCLGVCLIDLPHILGIISTVFFFPVLVLWYGNALTGIITIMNNTYLLLMYAVVSQCGSFIYGTAAEDDSAISHAETGSMPTSVKEATTDDAVTIFACMKSYTNPPGELSLNCSQRSISDFNVLKHIENVRDLQKLDMSLNFITHVKAGIFAVFSELVYLNLSRNRITDIEANAFDQLPNLVKLDLSHNLLVSISHGVFVQLSQLSYLDISSNQLKQSPNFLPMLEWFDVSNNSISVLKESTYSTVFYPQHVFLIGENPLTCDCKLLWLKELYETRKYILKFAKYIDHEKFIPKCAQPLHLQGKAWNQLDASEFECSESDSDQLEMSADNQFETNDGKGHVQDIASQFSVASAEVGANYITLEWNSVTTTEGASIEFTYHKFGEKNKKTLILPVIASSYRLRNLESNSPYVICYSVLNSMTGDCLEVMTDQLPENTFLSIINQCLMRIWTMLQDNALIICITFLIAFLIKCYIPVENIDTNKKET